MLDLAWNLLNWQNCLFWMFATNLNLPHCTVTDWRELNEELVLAEWFDRFALTIIWADPNISCFCFGLQVRTQFRSSSPNMPFKIIELGDDIQLISCLTKGAADDDDLQFFCHHKNEELSYCEKLPMLRFDQRIRVSLPLEVCCSNLFWLLESIS